MRNIIIYKGPLRPHYLCPYYGNQQHVVKVWNTQNNSCDHIFQGHSVQRYHSKNATALT